MKTSIIITGSGISSKQMLISSCTTFETETSRSVQGGAELIFSTKKDAINALSEAYQYLHSNKEDWNNSSASYSRASSLSYDAGYASIKPTEID